MTRRTRTGHAATAALIMAAERRGPLMHAHIGMLRALNFGKPGTKIAPPSAPKLTRSSGEKAQRRLAIIFRWVALCAFLGMLFRMEAAQPCSA